jgi:uncharacterized OsmC-like protein
MNTNLLNGVDTQVLGSVFSSIQNSPEKAKATFSVRSEWNGGFAVVSSCKDFQIGNQKVERKKAYTMVHDFPEQFSGEGKGPTVCESCMASLGTCITQTIVAHSTAMGIKLDKIRIDVEGDVDLRGFSGISKEVRPGAQQFRIKVHIESGSAKEEQINQLYEIGKKLSPAIDTLTNGTSLVLVNL